MSFSLRFHIPFPPKEVSPERLAVLFTAIHDVVVERFGCSLLIRPVTRRRGRDGSGPDERLFEFTVGLEGDVNPLEIVQSVDRVVDSFVESLQRDANVKA